MPHKNVMQGVTKWFFASEVHTIHYFGCISAPDPAVGAYSALQTCICKNWMKEAEGKEGEG